MQHNLYICADKLLSAVFQRCSRAEGPGTPDLRAGGSNLMHHSRLAIFGPRLRICKAYLTLEVSLRKAVFAIFSTIFYGKSYFFEGPLGCEKGL